MGPLPFNVWSFRVAGGSSKQMAGSCWLGPNHNPSPALRNGDCHFGCTFCTRRLDLMFHTASTSKPDSTQKLALGDITIHIYHMGRCFFRSVFPVSGGRQVTPFRRPSPIELIHVTEVLPKEQDAFVPSLTRASIANYDDDSLRLTNARFLLFSTVEN